MEHVKQKNQSKKILAVSSGGGHWVQLLRLRPAFEGCHVTYVTTVRPSQDEVETASVYVVNDANRWTKFALIQLVPKIASVLLREHPDVVISTGAAPGCIAVCLGKLFGAKTIWLDSIANAQQLSMSGKLAGRFADLWLTQWPHLASDDGPKYKGAVL